MQVRLTGGDPLLAHRPPPALHPTWERLSSLRSVPIRAPMLWGEAPPL